MCSCIDCDVTVHTCLPRRQDTYQSTLIEKKKLRTKTTCSNLLGK